MFSTLLSSLAIRPSLDQGGEGTGNLYRDNRHRAGGPGQTGQSTNIKKLV